MHTKNTKIVCTLGPSSNSVTEITELIQAGMNVARLNFSHGDYKSHQSLIKNIHISEKGTGKRIGILQDLQGPKIRINKMEEEIILKKGQTFTLTSKNITGTKNIIPIRYPRLTKDVKKNDIILIHDGVVEVKVLRKNKDGLLCKTRTGGKIKEGYGVNFPTSTLKTATITPKDKKDLKFGLKHKVDFVALSFVKSEKDIRDLRKLIGKHSPKIIAKIERHEAVKNLKKIIKEADGVMVARGDLGTDIPAEQVPIVQKRIISLANKYGKPVITATQVLLSMVENPIPTRAEISDAANAVFDHTDAIMLSNESAVGKYPTKATRTLTKVASTVEKDLQEHEELLEHIIAPRILSPLNATCLNACEIAAKTNADYIIVYTSDGYTARNIAKHRLYIPILTITPDEKVARQLTLVWGLNDVYIKKFSQKQESKKFDQIVTYLKKQKIARRGQNLVLVCNASKKESLISTIKI